MMEVNTGKLSEEELDQLLHESARITDAGLRIDFLSKQFLGTPYEEATLRGSIYSPEVFIINLGGVDCFTFIDYIEAMRMSGSCSEFTLNLRKIRYKSGNVDFRSRNHFFTDWREFNSSFVDDVTEDLGGDCTISVRKMLNLKKDGTYYLPGIPSVERELGYIPSGSIDESVTLKLKTGDYTGIYTDSAGLDVSHVGIIIRGQNSISLRHASSSIKHRGVVDEDFQKYISDKPGLTVLRPKGIAEMVQGSNG